jgi:hypothetical protein
MPGHALGGCGVQLLLYQGAKFVRYRQRRVGGCRLLGAGLLACFVAAEKVLQQHHRSG